MAELYVVVRIEGQGYGYMSRGEYEALPEPAAGRVTVLAACATEEDAAWLYRQLPRGWKDVVLGWRPGDSTVALEIVGGEYA